MATLLFGFWKYIEKNKKINPKQIMKYINKINPANAQQSTHFVRGLIYIIFCFHCVCVADLPNKVR